jgi:hypothetical protein
VLLGKTPFCRDRIFIPHRKKSEQTDLHPPSPTPVQTKQYFNWGCIDGVTCMLRPRCVLGYDRPVLSAGYPAANQSQVRARSEVVHQKSGASARRAQAWSRIPKVSGLLIFTCKTNITITFALSTKYTTTLQHQANHTTQSCRPTRDAARNLPLHHLRQKQNQTRQQWA